MLNRSSGLKLTKDNLIDRVIFKDISEENVTSIMLENGYIDIYKNYDNNMNFFQSLSKDKFNLELDGFLNINKEFKEINNLYSVNEKSGYYIMVLDEYSQMYVGTSKNIKARIQNHWAMQMHFDRMIFGSIDDSILSINSFRAYDTTRVFVYLTSKIFDHEDGFINQIEDKYLLNRTAGGLLSGLDEAILHRRNRNLN